MLISDDRRALHQIPELDRDLPLTMAYLRSALSGLRCQVFSPMKSSLCVFFDFGREDTVAFRSDADALPIRERSGVPFASRHEGCMHACGHDGHMAIALELARRVNEKSELPHNILIVFQPAEETTGGARDLCETGLFTKYRVQAIFGMHLWPGLPAGTIAGRRGEMMSRSCEVDVDVTGRSSHIARAEEGLDALAAAVLFYSRAVDMEAALPPEIFRLLKFGKMESGTVRNAVPAHAHLAGSLRAFQDEIYFSMRKSLIRIAGETEAQTGCVVSLHMSDGYPAVMNPPELCERVRRCADYTELDRPVMITEDFSWYQRYLPGAFFFLGAGDVPPLHADTFNFDESILTKGADFFERLAENFQ